MIPVRMCITTICNKTDQAGQGHGPETEGQGWSKKNVFIFSASVILFISAGRWN